MDRKEYGGSKFIQLGLRFLVKLCNDMSNGWLIGHTFMGTDQCGSFRAEEENIDTKHNTIFTEKLIKERRPIIL
jgi:hypothetical protein